LLRLFLPLGDNVNESFRITVQIVHPITRNR